MPCLFPWQILPLLYEAGNTPYQNGKLQHKLECLTDEASQICGREIQVNTAGSCQWHRMLVSLGLRMRDMVSPGNHVNPSRKYTKNSSFFPKLQAIMQAALDTAHSLCPAVVQKSGVRDQLVNAMSERIYLQDHLNLSTVLDQMVTDVFSKLKWVTCCSFFSPWGQMGILRVIGREPPSPHCGGVMFSQLWLCFLLRPSLEMSLGSWEVLGVMFLNTPPCSRQRGALTINGGVHLAPSIPDSACSHSCSGNTHPVSQSSGHVLGASSGAVAEHPSP